MMEIGISRETEFPRSLEIDMICNHQPINKEKAVKKLACIFTDGHSTYGITFRSFFKSRCLHKMFCHMRDIQVTCISAKFI